MPRKIYIRASDGATVPDHMALNELGGLRTGFTYTSVLQDGEVASFSMAFRDSAPAGRTALRDAAGVPLTLYDQTSGGSMKLNADLITAIEAEAAKLGMSVNEYVQHVLKYSWSAARLSGAQNPDNPGQKEPHQ